jgi:hypothetical protein
MAPTWKPILTAAVGLQTMRTLLELGQSFPRLRRRPSSNTQFVLKTRQDVVIPVPHTWKLTSTPAAHIHKILALPILAQSLLRLLRCPSSDSQFILRTREGRDNSVEPPMMLGQSSVCGVHVAQLHHLRAVSIPCCIGSDSYLHTLCSSLPSYSLRNSSPG